MKIPIVRQHILSAPLSGSFECLTVVLYAPTVVVVGAQKSCSKIWYLT